MYKNGKRIIFVIFSLLYMMNSSFAENLNQDNYNIALNSLLETEANVLNDFFDKSKKYTKNEIKEFNNLLEIIRFKKDDLILNGELSLIVDDENNIIYDMYGLPKTSNTITMNHINFKDIYEQMTIQNNNVDISEGTDIKIRQHDADHLLLKKLLDIN